MTNIYKGPEAGIEKEEAEKLHFRSKVGWKVFFFVILILELFSIAYWFFGHPPSLFKIVGELIVYTLSLLGIFGFAFNKKYLLGSFGFI
ncbi:hypothetical protein [Zooshikella sp. RANM57]|uniref:hypothetical protein n=1 Tax=Zooshikella sp. RANM57 TaxID=3425863 RepID=UPI003D6ECE93